jgi:hypothetical protein
MYSWIWSKLPGNRFLKLLQAAVLFAGLLALLYYLVFPWLDVVVFPETENRI